MEGTNGFDLLLRFLRTIVARKKLIFFGTLIPTVIAIVVVLVVESTYISQALVNPPQKEKGSPLSALGEMGGMGGIFGSLLGEESGYDDCISILESARFASQVIRKYDLETSYGFKKKDQPDKKYYYANVLKAFRLNASFEDTDEGAIKLSMKDTSATRAAEMLNYMIFLLDSLYTDVQKAAIKQNLAYIDERLAQAEAEMKSAEENLSAFQNKHNMYVPEAQVKLILESAAQTELRLATINEAMELEASLRGKTSARYRDLVTQKNILERTLRSQMRSSPNPDRLMLPTQSLPSIATEYFRLERTFAIRLGVYKYLVQQAELLKLDASKNIKVVSVIDPPWVNEKRVSPARRIVVQTVFVLSFLGMIVLVLLLAAWSRYKEENPEALKSVNDIRQGLRLR